MRVARALRELPLIRASFSCGELAYSKVRALTRVATPETGGAARLRRCPHRRAARACASAPTHESPRRRHTSCSNGRSSTTTGTTPANLIVHARLAPEDGALFLKASRPPRAALEGQQRLVGGRRGIRFRGTASSSSEQRRGLRGDGRQRACPHRARAAPAATGTPSSCRSRRRRCVATARVAASWRTALRWRRKPRDDSPATLRYASYANGTGSSSTSDGRRGRSHSASARRSSPATEAAAFRAVRTRATFTPTTSSTGPTAARPTGTTSSFFAPATTGSCTKAATRSRRRRLPRSLGPSDPERPEISAREPLDPPRSQSAPGDQS